MFKKIKSKIKLFCLLGVLATIVLLLPAIIRSAETDDMNLLVENELNISVTGVPIIFRSIEDTSLLSPVLYELQNEEAVSAGETITLIGTDLTSNGVIINLTSGTRTYLFFTSPISIPNNKQSLSFVLTPDVLSGEYVITLQNSNLLMSNNLSPIVLTVNEISNINVAANDTTTATVTWKTTNFTDSKVDYGFTTSYGTSVVGSGGFTTNHQVMLTGLIPGTQYNFRVRSFGSTGPEAVSPNDIFYTPVLYELPPPGIPSAYESDPNGGSGGGGGGSGGGVGTNLVNPAKFKNVYCFVQGVLGFAVQVGFFLAVFFIIFTGFKYVTARGNPAKVSEAHRMFLYTLIGTAVLLGAWGFAKAIEGTITQIRGSDTTIPVMDTNCS